MFSELVSLIQGYLRTTYPGGLSVFVRASKGEDLELSQDYSTRSQGEKTDFQTNSCWISYEVQIIEQKASVEVEQVLIFVF